MGKAAIAQPYPFIFLPPVEGWDNASTAPGVEKSMKKVLALLAWVLGTLVYIGIGAVMALIAATILYEVFS